MTLRDLGTWFHETISTVRTESVVDWPLWLLLVVGICAAFAALYGLAWVRLLGALAVDLIRHQRVRQLQTEHADRSSALVPRDPAERLEWANRTGRYADDRSEH